MEKEEHHSHHFEEHEEMPKWWKGPARIILMLFLLLIIVSWIVPYYSVRLNPEPADIPSLSYIQSQFLDGVEIGNETGTSSLAEAAALTDANDPLIKQVATKIATQSCPESKICQVKSLYYFVKDSMEYVSDPYAKEYVASPVETLKVGGGDCDDGALLLASLIESIGIETKIVIIPGHAFIKASMPEAPRKYRMGDWIYMDWTCRRCGFGEIPYNNILQLSD